MNFCKHCENMLYISVTEDTPPKMKFYCKNCNYSFEGSEQDHQHVISHQYNSHDDSAYNEKCVSSVNYNIDMTSHKQYINPLIKHDQTLPRVNNIVCPKDCTNGQNKEPEVIYIKYDHENMKYLYFCCNCEHFWKLE